MLHNLTSVSIVLAHVHLPTSKPIAFHYCTGHVENESYQLFEIRYCVLKALKRIIGDSSIRGTFGTQGKRSSYIAM